jgi:rhamnosyltransferase
MNATDGHASGSVCAVVVTYQPEPAALLALIGLVQPQVEALVVVDNGSARALLSDVPASVTVLSQPENIGLAAAQNLGIAWARDHGQTHVLLLDQDSEPAADMVAVLLDAQQRLAEDGHAVAAVGPTFFDPREGHDAPFVRIGFPVSEKIASGTEPFVQCDFLISSGALIPVHVLDVIGDMDADLFIDNVDLEWSFRARSRGYQLYGVSGARMVHHLGDDRRTILFGLRRIVAHSPIRLFYIMRNRTLLYRLPTTPRVWIAQDVLRLPVKFFIFAVLVGPRRQNVAMMLRGLRDGLLFARRGPMPVQVGAHP